MAEMAEATENVPFSVEYAKKQDCLEFQEHLNFREAYLKMHIEIINKFLPGRIKVLNDRIAVWEKISADNHVEKIRRFEKIKEAELVVQELKDEKKSFRNDLKETKWYKKQFMDPKNKIEDLFSLKKNLPWSEARGWALLDEFNGRSTEQD